MSSLTGLVDLPGRILTTLTKSGERKEGEQPEVWAEPIEQRFVRVGMAASKDAGDDLGRIAREWQFGARMQAQRDDLRSLVRQHYACRLTDQQRAVFWSVPQAVAQRWRASGILGPVTPGESLESLITEMAEAGRLTDLLDRKQTYAQMRAMAQKVPPSGADMLAVRIANETLVSAIEALSSRHGETVSAMAAMQHRKHLLSIVGNIPEGGRGRNVRERLARDMAAFLKGDDVHREWERAGVTTARYAYNLAVLSRMHEKNITWVAYDVQKDACGSCKRLLLHEDGSPRAFAVSQLWEQVAEDGGINIGRKASRIGKEDGWRVGLVIHPWCRCRPRKAKRIEIEREKKSHDDQASR